MTDAVARPGTQGEREIKELTHGFLQVLLIWIVVWRVPQDFSQKQRVFHQAASWNIKEIPEIQFAAKGGL